MNKAYLVVYCTCPDETTAARVSGALVAEGLAACVNQVPGVVSVYRWEGKVQRDREQLLIIKTRNDVYPALEERIRGLHPYEVPEIIALPLARGSGDYLAWIDGCLAGAP